MSKDQTPAHAPAPFALVSLPDGGHYILDAFRDSIAGMAPSRGDHTPEELLATARLFRAAPDLLAAVKLVMAVRPFNWDDGDDEALQLAWGCAAAAVTRAETGE
ncbi:hypothetical protein BH10PSE5_BH10PSE5_01530 [soil metagenome]